MDLPGVRLMLQEIGLGGAHAVHQVAHDLRPLVPGALDVAYGVAAPVGQSDLLGGDAGAVQVRMIRHDAGAPEEPVDACGRGPEGAAVLVQFREAVLEIGEQEVAQAHDFGGEGRTVQAQEMLVQKGFEEDGIEEQMPMSREAPELEGVLKAVRA